MDGEYGQQPEWSGCREQSAKLKELRPQVELLQKSWRTDKRLAAPFQRRKVSAPKRPELKLDYEYGSQAWRSFLVEIDERYAYRCRPGYAAVTNCWRQPSVE